MERARLLFGCYRRGDANDPDTYVAACAAVLARYSADIIREVTDPNTGISTTEKFASFMPNAGELKIYCEGVAARKERLERLGALPAPNSNRARLSPPEPQPGDLATVFVPLDNSRYQQFVDWAKTADPREWKYAGRPGIHVSYSAWENRQVRARKSADVEPERLQLSEAAQREMASRDAERNRTLPADQHREAAE